MCRREDKFQTTVCFEGNAGFTPPPPSPPLIDSNQPHQASISRSRSPCTAEADWKLHKYLTRHDALSTQWGRFGVSTHTCAVMNGETEIFTNGRYWNMNCGTKEDFGASSGDCCYCCCCQRRSLSERVTAKHITSIGLCLHAPNRSDKTRLTPGSWCAVWVHNRLKQHSATAPGYSHATCIF